MSVFATGTNPMSLEQLMTAIKTIFTGATSMVADVVQLITSNELLLLFCLFSFVGVGIGITKRLMNVQ